VHVGPLVDLGVTEQIRVSESMFPSSSVSYASPAAYKKLRRVFAALVLSAGSRAPSVDPHPVINFSGFVGDLELVDGSVLFVALLRKLDSDLAGVADRNHERFLSRDVLIPGQCAGGLLARDLVRHLSDHRVVRDRVIDLRDLVDSLTLHQKLAVAEGAGRGGSYAPIDRAMRIGGPGFDGTYQSITDSYEAVGLSYEAVGLAPLSVEVPRPRRTPLLASPPRPRPSSYRSTSRPRP
jgi:hypothetical protein